MSPRLRVQGVLQGGRGTGQIVADSHPDGWARGLANLRKGAKDIDTGQGALLQMMRTLPNGELHRGVVEVPPEGGISAALMGYMQNSEQVVSVIAVGCALEGGTVTAAGGYIVQLLPGAPEGPLMVITERLADFTRIEPLLQATDASPETLLEELLYGMPFARLEESDLRFDCNCSEVRVLASLATLSREEIRQFVAEAEPLEMSCDYCGREYRVETEQLRGLLESS